MAASASGTITVPPRYTTMRDSTSVLRRSPRHLATGVPHGGIQPVESTHVRSVLTPYSDHSPGGRCRVEQRSADPVDRAS